VLLDGSLMQDLSRLSSNRSMLDSRLAEVVAALLLANFVAFIYPRSTMSSVQ
jgi:hypothetical protein